MKYMLLIQFGDAPSPNSPPSSGRSCRRMSTRRSTPTTGDQGEAGRDPSDMRLERPETATTDRVERGVQRSPPMARPSPSRRLFAAPLLRGGQSGRGDRPRRADPGRPSGRSVEIRPLKER